MASQTELEETVRDAYKGQELAGVALVFDSVLGDDTARSRDALGSAAGKMLRKGRDSVRLHRQNREALAGTLRQFAQKNDDREEDEEERASNRPPEGPSGARLQERIEEVRDKEEAGLLQLPAASSDDGDKEVEREEEETAVVERGEIEASPVEPISRKRYVQIYETAAKRYGFEEDWYVLAAVGKVESDHGQNMGPSSAGARGPMQFLPSTWKQYGVDGDGDGDANIMDPKDAIPAAANYLKAGGAPEDWYEALYTYNHSGEYVKKVLGVAEGYRRLAKDDEVEPYTRSTSDRDEDSDDD